MRTAKENSTASKRGITTITISETTQKKVRKYCEKKGYKITSFADAALLFALQNDMTL